MKFFLVPFIFLLIQSSPFAAVDESRAMQAFAGEYFFIDDFTNEKIYFILDSSGEIAVDENSAYYEAATIVNVLGNDNGPNGLPIVNIMLAGGSDEQTITLHIRLYPKQYDDYDITARLLDFTYVENDGPNGWSFAEIQNTKLYKTNSSGKFSEVKKSKQGKKELL